MAPSAGATDEAEAALKQAEAELKTEAMGDGVIEAAQNYSQRSFVLLLASDPSARDKEYYRSLAREGVDAVLEIGRLMIHPGEGKGNLSIGLSITVDTRLIRTEDGAVLNSSALGHLGEGTGTFTEWGANNAQPFREEVDQTVEGLAKDILSQLFGPVTFPASESESP